MSILEEEPLGVFVSQHGDVQNGGDDNDESSERTPTIVELSRVREQIAKARRITQGEKEPTEEMFEYVKKHHEFSIGALEIIGSLFAIIEVQQEILTRHVTDPEEAELILDLAKKATQQCEFLEHLTDSL